MEKDAHRRMILKCTLEKHVARSELPEIIIPLWVSVMMVTNLRFP
jgi:hypothetical protein